MSSLMKRNRLFGLIVRFVCFGLLFFLAFRLVFIIRFDSLSLVVSRMDIFERLWYNGLRFDAQVLGYIVLPVTLLALVGMAITSERYHQMTQNIVTWYFPLMYTLVGALMLLDMQYYINFKSHFNLVLFDFFKEQPLVLMRSIWHEHPVIRIILCISILFILLRLISKWIVVKWKFAKPSGWYAISVMVAYLILLPVVIRGSVTLFPLRAEDMYISEHKEINDCVPNAIFMLKKAYSEKGKAFAIETPSEILHGGGFKDINEAIATYRQIPEGQVANGKPEDWIFKVCPKNKNARKYNVVFIVVESWSNKLMDYSSSRADLLCSMGKHLKEDVLFRNFQSAANGTINTLETITTSTPYQPLFTSKYRYQLFPTSVAEPFNQNQYNTEFISGIELSWRNLFEVLPNQNFKRVSGKYELLKEFPEAKCNNAWGVYDHDMLRCVFQKLQKQKKPNFFLCLTSTSHTPFELPQNYPLPDIKLSPSDMSLYEGDGALVKDYLRGYQYSNKALGDFMTWIKSSPLASNTIVVITGDHNIRMILPYTKPGSNLYQYSVPLYIYLPPLLRKKVYVDTSRMGSHYDIIPTIAPLVLSKARYVALGQNLFDSKKKSDSYYSINELQVLHDKGLTDKKAHRIAVARQTILKYYFQTLFSKFDKEAGKVAAN